MIVACPAAPCYRDARLAPSPVITNSTWRHLFRYRDAQQLSAHRPIDGGRHHPFRVMRSPAARHKHRNTSLLADARASAEYLRLGRSATIRSRSGLPGLLSRSRHSSRWRALARHQIRPSGAGISRPPAVPRTPLTVLSGTAPVSGPTSLVSDQAALVSAAMAFVMPVAFRVCGELGWRRHLRPMHRR